MPVQQTRHPLLPLMVETIERQTWCHRILEWVILDGTPDAASDQWSDFVCAARAMLSKSPRTRHIQLVDAGERASPALRTIGCFRNRIIDTMRGEWGVWMDDDDVYPNTRVQVAVELMEKENKEVAGCSPHYIVDPDLGNMTFQFKVFGMMHATNNTMAFRRSLLSRTRYDDHAKNAEEPSFLQKHTIPMAQIPPEHAVMQIAHKNNTYNKRELLMIALVAEWFQPDLQARVSCRYVGRSPTAFVRVSQRIYNAYVQHLFPDLMTN